MGIKWSGMNIKMEIRRRYLTRRAVMFWKRLLGTVMGLNLNNMQIEFDQFCERVLRQGAWTE